MAGVIGGVPRLPASSSKARMNRFNAGVGFKSSDQVKISGSISIEIVTSDQTDSTDLPSSPDNGKMVFLYSSDGSRRLCIYYAGIWYEEVLSQMS
jgi:hypothetical protein|tara:strand:+ start:3157 stop:3441 length:285 start_codon:yes stop_codon:yes gene_type:complete